MPLTTRTLFLTFLLLFACESKTTERTNSPDSTGEDGDEIHDNDEAVDTDDEAVDTDDEAVDTSDEEADDDEETGEPEPFEPTIWSGPALTFVKDNFADHTDPANQDAITDNVSLTRGDQGSVINVVLEGSHNSNSPAGTEWAQGSTAEIASLDFEPLKAAANNQMKHVPGTAFVLHLLEEDIYIDVTFLTWTSGSGTGGGFSYERSTQN